MINILHLRDTDKVCGPGKTILETNSRINKEQYKAYIGLFLLRKEKTNDYYDAAIEKGVPIIPIETYHQYDPFIVVKIIKLIKEHNIHILHSHEYKSDILAYIVSRIYKLPIVTTAHGWISNNRKNKLFIKWQKKLLPAFNKVICVSPLIREEVLSTGVTNENAPLIYNAIVVDNYNPDDYVKGAVRKRFNLPDNAILIGNIGRLSPEKGQIEFIYSASELIISNKNVYFVLVGDGNDREHLEKVVRDLRLEGRVFFTGHETDIQQVFKDLDILALTSYTEGFPNVVLEALCMGKPVLATDVGGVSCIIRNNETGILVKSKDVEAITKGLQYLVDEPLNAELMVSKGRELIMQEFQFDARVRKIEALYLNVLSKANKK